jgi:hypothetical protein
MIQGSGNGSGESTEPSTERYSKEPTKSYIGVDTEYYDAGADYGG